MTEEAIRIDKWLWAARFFKTRSLAKEAVEGGKVHYNQHRCKPGKTVELGAELKIRQGWVDKTVIVKGLSAQRKSASLAQALYEETEESVQLREKVLLERQQLQASQPTPQRRPNKRDRRLIHQFKNIHAEN